MSEEKPVPRRRGIWRWLRRHWLAVLDLILIVGLGFWQGCTQDRIAQMESTHVPMEEVIPTYPSTAYHNNMSTPFPSDIVFSYSGEKTASYFVEWYVVNSEGSLDNIVAFAREVPDAVSTITEIDGRKTETKEYKFLKEDEYTITATIYYFTGTPVGITEEEAKEYIKTNGESKQISYKVKVDEKYNQ